MDGSPHHLPLDNVILWDAGFSVAGARVQCARITASRLMLFVSTIKANVLIVWDWRTGGVVRASGFRLVAALILSTIVGSQAVQRGGRFYMVSTFHV